MWAARRLIPNKLGHPRCTLALLCFQRCAMRVCRVVTFITHPLSGHLFNAGLQMSGSSPAFTGQRCADSWSAQDRRADTIQPPRGWYASKQPTQKACEHIITQTQRPMYRAVSERHLHNNFTQWRLSHRDSMKHSRHWRSPVLRAHEQLWATICN